MAARIRPRRGAAPPTTPDAIEIAMEAEATGVEPQGLARTVLAGQVGLIEAQTRVLRLQAFNERAAGALKVLTGLAGVSVAVVLGLMAWTASQDRTVVFDAFSTPPDLAARGVTGQVVATRFLDHIRSIHRQGDDSRPDQSFRNSWGGEATVAIPGAGISVGDLMSLFRAWLGKETHFGGEVIRTADGYLVTARTDGVAPVTVRGGVDDLDATLVRAAEGLYREAEPYRYAAYLMNANRIPEARDVLEPLARTGPREEQPWAWSLLAVVYSVLGDQRQSLAAAQTALRVDPDFVLGHSFTGNTAYYIGLSELELQSYRKARKVGRVRGMSAEAFRDRRLSTDGSIAHLVGDYGRELEIFDRPGRAVSPWRMANAAIAAAPIHDIARARALRAQDGRTDDAARLPDAFTGEAHLVDYDIAAALDDWAAARDSIQKTIAALPPGRFWEAVRDVHMRPRLGVALARTGDIEGARRAVAGLAGDCYPCLLARARIESLANAASADLWFSRAVAQAPSIPFAYAEWGRARAAAGDRQGAIALYRKAAARGPRWADPLAYWGDALAASRDCRAALGKYRAAADRAPRWGYLQLAMGRCHDALRRPDQAAGHYRQALGLGLSAADRREAGERLSRTGR
ncbi:MAG: hypothetical protein EON95_09840 [Caulobacteraceae bacterium]|nr:MAG: hypothetical protein EON95_09840 [Caulobacteraceae bacterium]